MKKGNIILMIAWAGSICLLVLIAVFNNAKVDKFMGLTTNKEYMINFSYPVQLKETFVLTGQEVKKGELLATLIRSDLASKINILNSKISELKAKKSTKIDDINRRIQTLDIKYQAEIDKINMQIKQSQIKLGANKKLLRAIVDTGNGSFSTLAYKIKSQQHEKQTIQTIYVNDKKHLNQQLENVNGPFDAQINELLEEKNIINAKEDQLTVYSPIDGEIGSISYSKKSQIKPFDSILTIHSKNPEFVTGYIHEDIVNELKIGQRVSVTSFNKTDSSKSVTYGTIERIENRIEEIPVKLKKYKVVPLWGYKVFISLPENSLQLGKKVMIDSKIEKSNFESRVEVLLSFFKLT